MRRKRTPQSSLFWAPLIGIIIGPWGCGPGGDASPAQNPGASELPVLPSVPHPVRPGIEVLLSDSIHLIRGLRVGLITNHTGIDREGIPSIDRLVDVEEVDLVALFSPEHGIRGDAEGGITIQGGHDEKTGLPLHSLYGETRKPNPQMMSTLQVLLFDIQDVGARYYTYVSTMAMGMEAAGEAGIPFLVLDRPNPIGGVRVQGNVLDPAFSTFVGLYPVPMRHGMTPGELARLFVGEFGIEVDLHVVPVDGWTREMPFAGTNLPWVAPSPNMPSVESALHYPGTCLFEGTNLSVGRGTEIAFQIVGAPWIDEKSLAGSMETYGLPGVRFDPIRFTPRSPGDGKFGEEEIGGVQLVATGPDYDPTLAALALLRETLALSGNHWEWREAHFDRLAGTDLLRAGLEAGSRLEDLRAGWDAALDSFQQLRRAYLIYPPGQ